MKKIYILLVAGVLVLLSCGESFLDLYPETSITSPSFYKTAEHFDQALNATYTGLRNIAVNGMFMDEMRSDNAFYTIYSGGGGPYNPYETPCLFIDDAILSANAGPINERWIVNYQNIAKANTIIDKLDASELPDVEKAKVRAEALFLRAFYYFDLVKCFGGVPLYLSEVTSVKDAFLPRSSVEECYAQILRDLDSAIDLGLPIPARFPIDNSGRAKMGAARMLRAYANMTKPNPDYTTAETDLMEITKMNYKLLNSYEDVFNPQNKNHEEMIFDVQYTEDGSTNQYSVFAWRFAPKCSNLIDMMGVGGSNYGAVSGGWVVPTKEMVDSYEPGDTRLPASIVVVEGYSEGDNFYYEQIREVKDYVVPPGKDYRYMVNKYFNPPYIYSLRADENFPIYRYAGALLLLSECLVRQGKESEALPYINQVRARAGIPALGNVTLEDVANEMRHELAYENHRWSDLKRTGFVKEVMTAHGERIKDLHPWVRATNNDGCFIIDDFRMIYAIPPREIDINNLLEQNPGY